MAGRDCAMCAPGGPIAWQQILSSDPVPDAELHDQAAGLRALLTR